METKGRVDANIKIGRLICCVLCSLSRARLEYKLGGISIHGYLGIHKAGNLAEAQKLFDEIPRKDVISWTTMASGYAKAGEGSASNEATELFNQMLKSEIDIQPDKMTLASVMSACSQLGDLEYEFWIESHMTEFGIALDDHLGTTSIDLYAKCGSIEKGYELLRVA
ncbi:hypothetical protein L6164_025484 [Bauhinia variegata]|uniref:Uncharacterized protein n=1 Tax=Bauhinia variegata TaxID=167791 RepID=A0ACB9M115_BAUVA|nr:hypothetical protein L6164_025484 [Bauhinia variegata]